MRRVRLPRWARGLVAALKRDMAKNTFWIVSSSVVNMALGLVVTALTARYFGPTEFGRFNYALALVVLFTAFSTLGLETLTVRSLVAGDHEQPEVMGTSLILRLCGGLVLTGISLGTVFLLEPNDRGVWVLVSLLSLMMVLRAGDVIDYWFQSRLKSKIAGLIRIGSYTIASAVKVLLIVCGGTIYQFAAIYSLDALVVGIAFAIAFRHLNRGAPRWRWDADYAKYILARSWYIMLSGLAGTVYMRVDQVMLGAMFTDKTTLGVFAAAVTVATMWYFIPAALISSVNPGIMRASGVLTG
jgi:O-antigen/teichoic acid export membrane protein